MLDYGSQYTQLIARRVRELHVHADILPWDVDPDRLRARQPQGVILSGGPASVTAPDAPTLPDGLLALDVPVLGICYGMQVLAHTLGGEVAPGAEREYGPARITVSAPIRRSSRICPPR